MSSPSQLRTDVKSLLERATSGIPGRAVSSGASEEELQQFEARTGWTLPPEWREFLLFTNGSWAGYGGIYGVRPDEPHLDMESHLRSEREARSGYPELPPFEPDVHGWLPIAGDGCGSSYVIPVKEESSGMHAVYFRDHEHSERLEYVVASGPWEFVALLLRAEAKELRWPFDRGTLLRLDPRITRATLAPLPWDADEYWEIRGGSS